MELQPILKAPLEVAKFIGARLIPGGWAELPPIPESDIVKPVRANIQYITTGVEK